jgi:hypothetical protein
MPTFEIELDDGRKFHVDADSQDAALSGVKQMFGGQQQQKQQPADTSLLSAPAAGAGEFIAGLGKTAKHYLPDAAEGLATSLEKTGEGMVPKGYEGAKVYSKEKGLDVGELPRKVAEAAPGAAAGLAAAKLTPGPWYLKALMGAGTYLASQAGNRAEERAAAEGGDAQHPTTQQKTIGGLTAAAESIPAAVGVGRLLPGSGSVASRVGAQGVADAVKRAGATAAIEGGVGASQSAIGDVGTTIGTEGGIKVDPAKAIDAGLGNAALSPVFSGPRAVREAGEARRYSGMDPEIARLVANDLHTVSGGGDKAGGNLSNGRKSYEAMRAAETNYKTDLNSAVKSFGELNGEAAGVLARARDGQKLSERDLNIIDNVTAGRPEGAALNQSIKKLNTLALIKDIGHFDSGNSTFRGGAGSRVEQSFSFIRDPLKGIGAAGIGAVGLGHAGMLLPSAHYLGATGGAYLAARALDKALGTRLPARSFVQRFAGEEAPNARAAIPPSNPTGPKIRQYRSPWEFASKAPEAPAADPQKLLTFNPQEGYDAGPGRSGPIPQPAPPEMPMLPPPRGPSSPMREPTAPINQPMDQRLALPPPQSMQMPDQSSQPQLPAPLRALLPALRRMQLPAQPPENPGIAGGLGLEAVRRATEPAVPAPAPQAPEPVTAPRKNRTAGNEPEPFHPSTEWQEVPSAGLHFNGSTFTRWSALEFKTENGKPYARIAQAGRDAPQPVASDDIVAAADRVRAEIAKRNPPKREDLDAGTRARIANLKAQTEALRAKGVSTDYTPAPVSKGPVEMPDIPAFLRRTKGEEPAPVAAPAAVPVEAKPETINFSSAGATRQNKPTTIGGVTAARLVRRGFTPEQFSGMRNGVAQEILTNEYSPADATARGMIKATPAPEPVTPPVEEVRKAPITKRPVAVSALAAKIAAQHNSGVQAEKNRTPVTQDEPAPKAQGKSLSMTEEMNQDSVLNAVKNGATDFASVRAATREDVDIADLKSTLNRMRDEGHLNIDGKGKIALPGQSPASETMSSALAAKAEEPRTSGHYVPGKSDETVRNIVNSDWIEKKGFTPNENIRKGIERIVLAKHGAADAVKEATGVDIGSQLIAAGTRVEGRAIRDKLVEQHPDAREAIYKSMNEDFIANTWKKEGGPTKKEQAATAEATTQKQFEQKTGSKPEIWTRELQQHHEDNKRFDDVVERLRKDKTIREQEMREIATSFLGFEPAKSKGRTKLLTEIVNWQALDARQKARIGASSDPGALPVSEHKRNADDLLARMIATAGRTAG